MLNVSELKVSKQQNGNKDNQQTMKRAVENCFFPLSHLVQLTSCCTARTLHHWLVSVSANQLWPNYAQKK